MKQKEEREETEVSCLWAVPSSARRSQLVKMVRIGLNYSHTQKPFSVHRELWVQIADVIHGLAGVGGASWGVGVVVVRVARMSLSWSWNVPAVSLNERVSKKTHQAVLRSKA